MSHSFSDPDIAARNRAWSSYWAGGAQHSCAGSFVDNYAGNIAEFWSEIFAGLEAGARVLDACCGNVALGRLLMESGFGEKVAHLSAVDAAQVAPTWLAEMSDEISSRVEIHGETDVAATPFAGASFDLCMSQYGIEYVGAPAFAECGRLLRDGGRLAAVLHHSDSLPVRIGREESGHIDLLLDHAGLYERAGPMIELMMRATTEAGRAELASDSKANSARSALNDALRAVKARIDGAKWPDVLLEHRDAVMQLLGRVPQIGVEAGQRHLESLRQALIESRVRQRELVAYSLDEAGVRNVMAAFPGAIRQLDPLRFDNGEIAGWSLVAVRS